ncbi:EamA family transporter [Acidicapsa acidisoli]|uniref:EamA family transporter n=1 Tax=Acidicapsa acidisoli TaxID=1615681 RepID=UPI0021E05D20|nr:EamA family transporter [Acidicapsa acidisoli]
MPVSGSPASSIASVSLGLAAATTWGGSDFAGGIGARRHPAMLVVASGHLVTLLLLLVWCGLGHFALPHRTEFLEGAIGGIEGSLALVLFYRALAMGAMGLTAALTGLLTALVPVLYGLWSEGLPAPKALAGLVLGGVAIWLVCYSGSHSPGHNTPPLALFLGAISGAGFGLQLILFKLAANDGVLWALTSARIGGVLGMAAILAFVWPRQTPGETGGQIEKRNPESRIPGSRIRSGFWRIGILAGILDTMGNLGYTLAAHTGRLDLAAMVSSLYPGFTILLAAVVLRERPTGRQALGMVVALASVVLLSL